MCERWLYVVDTENEGLEGGQINHFSTLERFKVLFFSGYISPIQND